MIRTLRNIFRTRKSRIISIIHSKEPFSNKVTFTDFNYYDIISLGTSGKSATRSKAEVFF